MDALQPPGRKRHRNACVAPGVLSGSNPSRKRSANGRPPGPVWRYAVHFRQPALASGRHRWLGSNVGHRKYPDRFSANTATGTSPSKIDVIHKPWTPSSWQLTRP